MGYKAIAKKGKSVSFTWSHSQSQDMCTSVKQFNKYSAILSKFQQVSEPVKFGVQCVLEQRTALKWKLTRTHEGLHAHMHTHTHACTHARMHARTHAHTHTHRYTHTHMHAYTQAHAHAHTHACMHTHTHMHALTHI